MNCRVVVEAAVPVYDVETPDEAIRIGISKTGEMLNPDLNYVEIEMAERTAPSGEELPPAFIAADEALVALELEMTVFNVEREEHASRIARKEIGQRLENIPLEVLEVEVLETDDEEADDDETGSDTDDSGDDGAGSDTDDSGDGETGSDADDSGDDGAGSDTDDSGDETEESVLEEKLDEEFPADGGDEHGDGGTGGDDEVLPEFEELIDE